MLHNAHPKRNIGAEKRGEPSEAKSETRYKKKVKKEQSHCAWFSGFPVQQIRPGVMKSAERYDLAKTKYRELLADYLFTHFVKYGVIIVKEVAYVAHVPDLDHTLCPKFEHNYPTKLYYRKWE